MPPVFRTPFLRSEALAGEVPLPVIRSRLRSGAWNQVIRGVYVEGPEAPNALEHAAAVVLKTGAVASHLFAAQLYGLDGVPMGVPFATRPSKKKSVHEGVCHQDLDRDRCPMVAGIPTTSGERTLIDIAFWVTDAVWEQALECALRKRLTTVARLERQLPGLSKSRFPGVVRMRTVLEHRPAGAAPTESILETLMIQLLRTDPSLPVPTRQWVVRRNGRFIGRVDLCLPDQKIFFELDGREFHQDGQYDASRQTAVVAATGWLPLRFTWADVVHRPESTLRRVHDVLQSHAALRVSPGS